MATSYTSLLGLALPATGELQGTWGTTVNDSITSLLDTAVAGTTVLNTDADVTLSTTTGSANQARQAIILWTANGSTTRNITAPAQSKAYVVMNSSAGTQSIVIRGVGPTTGVTIVKNERALVAWNGSDFVKVSSAGVPLPIVDGGTGASTRQDAMDALAGAVTSGQYLRGNGTDVVMSAIQAGDVPTLNQNTTGTASNVTGVVAAANGGTGQSSYAVGDLLYASATATISKLADVATGNALISGGVGVAPSWGKVGLTTHISGTLGPTNGGTGLSSATTGDLLYASAANTWASLADVATGNALISGGVGVAPSWGKVGLTTHISGTLAIANGGSGATTAQDGMNAFAGAVTAGQYLRGNGTNVVMSAIQAGDVPTLNQNTTGTASNVTGTVAIANGGSGTTTAQGAMDAFAGAVTAGQYLRGNGTNVVMSAIQAADVPTLNQNTTGTASNVTGTVAIGNGGTGATTAQGGINALAGATTSGQYLRGNGTNVVMSAIQAGDVPTLNQNTTGTASNVTGTVAVANGGTGATSLTGVLIGNGTSAVTTKTNPSGAFVGTTDTQTLSGKTITGLQETRVAMGANNIDLSLGNFFSKTISGATTFTVSNVPATDTAASFILDLTNGGSAAITWWANTKWAGGTAPTLTTAGRDVLGFFTYDNGSTWTGLVLGKDVK